LSQRRSYTASPASLRDYDASPSSLSVRSTRDSGAGGERTDCGIRGRKVAPAGPQARATSVPAGRGTGMCTARSRSSLIPSRVSPRWSTLRAGESLDGSNPAAREPLREGESTHLRSQRTPGGYLARGTPPSSLRGMKLTRRPLGWLDRLPCVPINDDRGHRGVLGAASLGTVVGVRCAVGVQGSPTGRGAGSLRHAPPSRRAERVY
jgi:hypothetical protein